MSLGVSASSKEFPETKVFFLAARPKFPYWTDTPSLISHATGHALTRKVAEIEALGVLSKMSYKGLLGAIGVLPLKSVFCEQKQAFAPPPISRKIYFWRSQTRYPLHASVFYLDFLIFRIENGAPNKKLWAPAQNPGGGGLLMGGGAS